MSENTLNVPHVKITPPDQDNDEEGPRTPPVSRYPGRRRGGPGGRIAAMKAGFKKRIGGASFIHKGGKAGNAIEMHREMVQLKENLAQAAKVGQGFLVKNKELEEEIDGMKEHIAKRENYIANLEEAVTDRTRSYEELETEFQDVRNQLNAKQLEMEEMKKSFDLVKKSGSSLERMEQNNQQLRKQVVDTTAELKKCQDDLEKYSLKSKSLETETEQRQVQMNKMKVEFEEKKEILENENVDLKKKLANTRKTSKETLNQVNKKWRLEMNKKQKEMEEIKEKNKQMLSSQAKEREQRFMDQIQAKDEQLEEFQKILNQSSHQVEEMREEVKKMELEKKVMESKLSEREKKMSMFEELAKKMRLEVQKEKKNFQTKKVKWMSFIETMKGKHDEKANQLKKSKSDLKHAFAKAQELMKAFQDTKKDLNKKTREVEDKEMVVTQYMEKCELLSKEKNDLNEKMKSALEESETERKKLIQEHTNQDQHQKTLLEQKQNACDQLMEKYKILMNTTQELESKNATLLKDINNIKLTLSSKADISASEYERERNQNKNKIEELETNLSSVKNELKETKDELKANQKMFDDEKTSLELKSMELKQNIDRVEQELKSQKFEYETLQKKHENVELLLKDEREEKQAVQSEFHKVKSELEARASVSSSQYEEQVDLLKEKEERIKTMKEKKKKYKNLHETLSTTYDREKKVWEVNEENLQRQVKDAQDKLEFQVKKYSDTNQLLENTKKELDDLLGTHSLLKNERTTLEGKLEDLKMKHTSDSDTHSEIQKQRENEIKGMKTTIEELRTELHNLKEEKRVDDQKRTNSENSWASTRMDLQNELTSAREQLAKTEKEYEQFRKWKEKEVDGIVEDMKESEARFREQIQNSKKSNQEVLQEAEKRFLEEKAQLSEMIKKVEDERERKAAALMEQLKSLTQFKVMIHWKQTQISQLTKRVDGMKKDKEKMEDEKEQMRDEITGLNEKVKKLERRVQYVEELESENDKYQRRIIDMKSDLKITENLKIKETKSNNRLEERIRELDLAIKKYKTTQQHQQSRINVLKKQLVDQDASFREERETFDERLKKAFRSLKTSKNKTTLKSRDHNRQVSNQRNLIEKYQEEIIMLKGQLRSGARKQHNMSSPYKNNSKHLKRELMKHMSEVYELRRIVEVRDKEIKRLRRTSSKDFIGSRKGAVELLHKQLREKDQKLISYDRIVRELGKKCKDLKKEDLQRESELNTLEDKIGDLCRLNSEQSTMIVSLNQKITSLRADNTTLRKFGPGTKMF